MSILKVSQGCAPSKSSREGPSCLFQILRAPVVPGLVATLLQSLPPLSNGCCLWLCQISLCLLEGYLWLHLWPTRGHLSVDGGLDCSLVMMEALAIRRCVQCAYRWSGTLPGTYSQISTYIKTCLYISRYNLSSVHIKNIAPLICRCSKEHSVAETPMCSPSLPLRSHPGTSLAP